MEHAADENVDGDDRREAPGSEIDGQLSAGQIFQGHRVEAEREDCVLEPHGGIVRRHAKHADELADEHDAEARAHLNGGEQGAVKGRKRYGFARRLR